MTQKNKLQILSAQIQTDLKDLSDDIGAGINRADIMASLERVNEKIREWAKEAERIISEAEAIDNIADSQPEVQAERSAEEKN